CLKETALCPTAVLQLLAVMFAIASPPTPVLVAAGCVARKRCIAGRHVVAAGCVVNHRIQTKGRVEAAGGCLERNNTDRRVTVAASVVQESLVTHGCIVIAGCVAKERLRSEERRVGKEWGARVVR